MKLGIRRQAKQDTADYLVLADDLLRFDLRDIAAGLDDIGKAPRRDGETAFPELGRLLGAIGDRRVRREAEEEQAEALRAANERDSNPEQYISWKEIMSSPEATSLMNKLAMAKRVS